MRIIAFTGLAQSGKDTAARYVSSKYGYKWFDFSRDALEDELRRRLQPVTKENMSALGDELRAKYGADALAQKLVDKIRKSRTENIVVSGVRSPAEAEYLKENAENFILVRIAADPKKRVARSGNSNILDRDARDISNKGLLQVLELADITIENNGTVDELYRKIDEVITRQALL